MQVKPLNGRVLVKPVSLEQATKTGIIIPETIDKEKPEKGEVVAVGEGRVLENGSRLAMTVKVGDTVVFKKYSPDEIKVDGAEYLILDESDILAIIA